MSPLAAMFGLIGPQEQMGTSVLEWGAGVFLQVSPQALYTFAS